MEVYDLLNLPLVVLNEGDVHKKIEHVYIGDLLSFVISKAKEGSLWLTVQKHLNVVAVAELNDFAGIVFVQGVLPDDEALKKAIELDLPLFSTSLDAYSFAKELSLLGL